MSDEIVPQENEMKLGIIPARTPHDVIVQATSIATELAGIIRKNKLANVIQGRQYVRVEGWSTMGAMLGILPREKEVKRREDGGYEASIELIRTTDGMIVGGASALVGIDEKTWGNRAEYARRSMAITRATGKAYRLGFSWIMTLAGYEPTPAEEIPQDVVEGEFKETKEGNGTTQPTELELKLVDIKVVENIIHARAMIKTFKLDKFPIEEALKMAHGYRGWRDMGASKEDAVRDILAGKYPT